MTTNNDYVATFPSHDAIINYLEAKDLKTFSCTKTDPNGKEIKYSRTLAAAFAGQNMTLKQIKDKTWEVVKNWPKDNADWEKYPKVVVAISKKALYKFTKNALIGCVNEETVRKCNEKGLEVIK